MPARLGLASEQQAKAGLRGHLVVGQEPQLCEDVPAQVLGRIDGADRRTFASGHRRVTYAPGLSRPSVRSPPRRVSLLGVAPALDARKRHADDSSARGGHASDRTHIVQERIAAPLVWLGAQWTASDEPLLEEKTTLQSYNLQGGDSAPQHAQSRKAVIARNDPGSLRCAEERT
jgi:hypothetical protein